MLTRRQVQKQCPYANVYTLKEFGKMIDNDTVNAYDGQGYFHDGEKLTDISPFNCTLTWEDVKDYKWVCWWNK